MATDKERLDAAAKWIRQNQDKQGTPEWEKVTAAYKQLRGVQTEAQPPALNPARSAADAQVAREHAEGGFGYDLTDALRQTAKGVPFAGGLIDEGVAQASEALGGDYENSLEYQRARDRLREKLHPQSALGLNVLGGAGAVLAAAPALGLGSLGVGTARPLAQRALAGAVIGAPAGAADSFMRGEGGLENRAGQAALGGIIGGATGMAAPVVGQGLASGYEALANRLWRAARVSGLGVTRPVAEELIERAQADDVLGNAAARIRQGGQDAMLADAGPNVAGQLDATIQRGGPGATLAARAVDERALQASRDVRGTLDRTFGAPVGAPARQTAIREGTAAARGQAYDAAYASPIDYTSRGGNIVAGLWRRVSQPARQTANRLLNEGGFDPIRPGQLPTVRQLDYVTRALYDVAESGEGQGALGGINAVGRSAQALAGQLRNALGDAVPAYRTALDTAADPIRRIQAIGFGSELLNGRVTRSMVAEELDGMSAAERRSIMEGLRDRIDDIAANVKQMASDPNIDARELRETLKAMTSRSAREKVGLVLDNPNQAMRFFREIGQAMRSLELRANISTNSRTAARQEAIRGMEDRMKPGVVGTAMQGDFPGAAKKAVQFATGATPRQQRDLSNRQWLEMARTLTEARGRDAERLLRRFLAAGRARALTNQRGTQIGRVGAGAVAGTQPILPGAIHAP